MSSRSPRPTSESRAWHGSQPGWETIQSTACPGHAGKQSFSTGCVIWRRGHGSCLGGVPGKAPSRGTLSGTHVRGVSITQAPAGLRCLGLVGPDVARALLWAVGSLVAPLVRRGTKRTRKRDIINGRATFEQGHRLSPPAIARQWAKLGVGVLHAARAGQAATAIARQVVALIGDVGAAVVEAVAARVFGDDAPADIDLSVI